MADKLLFDARKELVERVSSHVLLQLLDDLLQDRVLNDGEKDAVIEENKSTADKARCLLDKVRKRGPKASGKFISRLQERDPDLCELLNLGPVSPPAPPSPSELSLPLPQQEVTCSPSQQEPSAVLIPCTPQFKKALLEKEGAEIYPMKEKGQRKRMALLINNVKFDHLSERRGAEKDVENMEEQLKALDYTVETHRDLSAQDINEAVKGFSQHQAHLESDSTFVVIMSHGKRDAICGIHYNPKHPQENNLFLIDNIFTHLNTENCAGLRNKPKVIVIQACRGGEIGTVWVSDSASAPKSLEDDGMWRELKERDFACLMACTPDKKSYRHPEKGAILIQKLVETINTHAHKDHIEELFRKVRNQFDRSKFQMPVTDRTSLGKKFYLFPGL
ncbi:caspase a-like isoform X1 [Conger conger]|uniref:caspase a-like isoform X1 n=1 Tax=Conger conger TaxID=82655 RepID=UPI002A59D8AF|nr:caspase a-like isoform X1 [Conger conger]